MEKRWIKILALFRALSLNNNEDILCDFKTLGLALFQLFCVWVIQDHLNNAGLSFSLSSHSWQWGGEDAFTDLQCLIHTVCVTTGQALYVQRNEEFLILSYHHNTTMDIWGLRRCSRPCLQTADRQGLSRWEASFSAGEHVLGSPLPITEQQQAVLCLPETRVRGSLSFPNSLGCGCKQKVVTLVCQKKKKKVGGSKPP